MTRWIAVALCLAVLPRPSVAQMAGPATCPTERAVYEMTAPDTDEIWRIALVPGRDGPGIASDLYLRLTTPQRAYWFYFSVSQGYSGISVFPVTNPYADSGPRDLLGPPFGSNPDGTTDPDVLNALRFLALDADLHVGFEPPMRDQEAPPYIMLPELGRALWYSAKALTDDPDADRDPMPRGLFRRTQCLVAPHPPA